ncbi:DUF899 domain-containing protein [Pseudoxanthomonas japonensis]|nr:DUF899 domain-containing protein [Pseudoxanthomonas japonensis]
MNLTTRIPAASPRIVSREQWLKERMPLLAREKELTRLGDRIAEERRALPWVKVEKDYVLDTVDGPRRLDQLFDGRHQLLVQHFMFTPGRDQGCRSCSYMADHHDGARAHLAQRDTTLLVISRAPLADIQRFRARMGWQFPWVSSFGSDFNYDFGVSFTPEDMATGAVDYNYAHQYFPHSEAPGISVFHRDDAGTVFHTYSRFGRGVEVMMGTYPLLDLTPKGRDEAGLEDTMSWVRHHDLYEQTDGKSACGCHG